MGAEEISVELKSVNHKFCEVKVRLPRELNLLESQVVKAVKERFARGAIEVSARRQSAAQTASVPVVDTALAREYHRAWRELSEATGLLQELSLEYLAAQPGIIRVEERVARPEDLQGALETALSQAMDALVRMREQEGATIAQDLSTRLEVVARGVESLQKLAPRAVEEYRERLLQRIGELTREVNLDPQRLVQEVAYFAERTDVAEELTRLNSHLDQFRALLASTEPSGRRMDFLVQEMHREVNTTGSKSQHPDISNLVVTLKAELERIREQVQNVE